MARWWRLFIDKLTGKSESSEAFGPRRRKSERYSYKTQVSAKCSSWPKFVELFTGNVSAGGLFVPTSDPAQIGETVDIRLTLPNGDPFELRGTVVNIITNEQAARLGKNGGLGIKLDELEGSKVVVSKKSWQQLAPACQSHPL